MPTTFDTYVKAGVTNIANNQVLAATPEDRMIQSFMITNVGTNDCTVDIDFTHGGTSTTVKALHKVLVPLGMSLGVPSLGQNWVIKGSTARGGVGDTISVTPNAETVDVIISTVSV